MKWIRKIIPAHAIAVALPVLAMERRVLAQAPRPADRAGGERIPEALPPQEKE